MRFFSKTRLILGAVLLALLGVMMLWAPRPAPAQPMPAPARPAAAPIPRAASCHNGLSFDRFLAELKQQAVAAGVSQRAIGEASPYLVYDQGIVNRDRGQRVFGQVFTEFAGRMAATYRMQQGQAQDQDPCGGLRARREGIWRAAGCHRRVLGAGKRFRRQHGQPADAALAGVAGL